MNCYLPIVLVCTTFILYLISTTMQSFQVFLPVKQFCLMSNLNLQSCNFWPLPLSQSSGTTEDLSLPGKEALLTLPAGFLLHLSALSELLAR